MVIFKGRDADKLFLVPISCIFSYSINDYINVYAYHTHTHTLLAFVKIFQIGCPVTIMEEKFGLFVKANKQINGIIKMTIDSNCPKVIL